MEKKGQICLFSISREYITCIETKRYSTGENCWWTNGSFVSIYDIFYLNITIWTHRIYFLLIYPFQFSASYDCTPCLLLHLNTSPLRTGLEWVFSEIYPSFSSPIFSFKSIDYLHWKEKVQHRWMLSMINYWSLLD